MDVHLVVVPYDSGASGIRMGAGPHRLLELGLAERLEGRGAGVTIQEIRGPEGPLQSEVATAFALNHHLSAAVRSATELGRLPVVLTGNCISAVGAVAGLDGATGVFWFDAHGDFNTPESTTGGFLDGMALAIVAGRCWRRMAGAVPGFSPVPEEDLCLLGTRELDGPEEALLEDSGVTVLPPAALDSELGTVVGEVGLRIRQAYLHLDLDVMDPADGRANHFAGDGGVPLEALVGHVDRLVRAVPPGAVTLSAYDPAADSDGRAGRAALRLLETVTEAMKS